MNRINVIGTSGSGKSTFAKQLSDVLQSHYIEMDALNWKANWTEAEPEEFVEKLEKTLALETWVLDGNYSRTNDLKWNRSDTIVWIDYGFIRTFYQVIKRSLQRAWTKQEVWPGTGNRESFKRSFFSSDSVIHWMLINYHRNKKRYAKLMDNPPYPHIQCIRIKSPQDAKLLLSDLRKKQAK